MPLAEAKEDGPMAVLTFLNIEVDITTKIIRLLKAKCEAMQGRI